MNDLNLFEKCEKAYSLHDNAKKLCQKREAALEKQRGYFWRIVGDPPHLKSFTRFLKSDNAPYALLTGVMIVFVIVVNALANAMAWIAIVGSCLAVIYVIKKIDITQQRSFISHKRFRRLQRELREMEKRNCNATNF